MTAPDLSSLSIFLATREQAIESRRRSHVEWARGLSMEDYLKRDEFLESTSCARNGAWVTWVLAPRDQPETLEFRSSCETFRRKGIMARPGDLEAKVVTAYAIASVFTPPQNRGKGYAQRMMRLLHWVIANEGYRSQCTFPKTWGEPPIVSKNFGDGMWSSLYSDVGSSFYARCGVDEEPRGGWIVKSPQSTVWHVESWIEPSSREEWGRLDRQSVEETWLEDSIKMRGELAQSATDTNRITVSFQPMDGVGGFQIERTIDIVTSKFLTQVWGVRLLKSREENVYLTAKDEKAAYATWSLELGSAGGAPRALVITRLRCPPERLQELLGEIIKVAQAVKAPKVEVWNVPDALRARAEELGARTEMRSNHLPSLKWYGEGEPEWMFNEWFCWC